MLAGAVLLTAMYFSLSRGVHPGVIFLVESHGALLRYFAPIAAIVMAFLLVFGLLGGWLLAGRMLAPLTRITDATRIAANGSLSHRIQLDGRSAAQANGHSPRSTWTCLSWRKKPLERASPSRRRAASPSSPRATCPPRSARTRYASS